MKASVTYRRQKDNSMASSDTCRMQTVSSRERAGEESGATAPQGRRFREEVRRARAVAGAMLLAVGLVAMPPAVAQQPAQTPLQILMKSEVHPQRKTIGSDGSPGVSDATPARVETRLNAN